MRARAFPRMAKAFSSRPIANQNFSGSPISILPTASTPICRQMQSSMWMFGILSGDGKQIAYTLNENGVSTLHVVDVVDERTALRPSPLRNRRVQSAVEKCRHRRPGWHRHSLRLLAFNVTGARAPFDVYTWDTRRT